MSYYIAHFRNKAFDDLHIAFAKKYNANHPEQEPLSEVVVPKFPSSVVPHDVMDEAYSCAVSSYGPEVPRGGDPVFLASGGLIRFVVRELEHHCMRVSDVTIAHPEEIGLLAVVKKILPSVDSSSFRHFSSDDPAVKAF